MGPYRTYLATLVLAAFASYFLTPPVRRLAFRIGALDHPGPRKVHATPMPRLGGLAVFGGFCFPWAGFYLLANYVTQTFQNYEKLFLLMMAGATAMLLLGVYDDVRGLNAPKKFLVQMAVAFGLFLGGFRIEQLSLPFGGHLDLDWLALPVSVLWIVGITNAINLLDGIDGLAAGVTACIALSLAVINGFQGQIIVALLTLCLAGACLGFLPHNFSPARIFLGDSGSLFVGLILACIGMISLFKAATATFVAIPLILFGLPLFDTTSVMVGRVLRGVPIFQADKTHVHHRLLNLGLTHKQAAYLLYSVSVALGSLGVLLSTRMFFTETLLIAGVVALFGLVSFWAWHRSRA